MLVCARLGPLRSGKFEASRSRQISACRRLNVTRLIGCLRKSQQAEARQNLTDLQQYDALCDANGTTEVLNSVLDASPAKEQGFPRV